MNNDIISERIQEFKDIPLNQYGLFESMAELVEFIEARAILMNESGKNMFEKGKFVVYRLSEIIQLCNYEIPFM